MSKSIASDIVDITAQVPSMEAYRFLSTSGTLTVKGFFVDGLGHQVGSSFTGTVSTSEAKTWEDIAGAALDGEVVGFRGCFSVAAYYELLRGSETDFEANPTNYPQIPAGSDVRIGRVAMVDTGPNSVTLSGAVDTELPAAAALADNTANPTVPGVGSFNHVWDGATWDRMPGTAADGVQVNLAGNNDVIPYDGLRVVEVTFTIDNANALDANDVAVAGDIIAACVRANDSKGWLVGIMLLDGDDNTAGGYNLFFFSNNVTLGTIDAAISISDADAFHQLGKVPIASGDWDDLIGCKSVTKVSGDQGLPMAIVPKTGTDDIYVGIQCLGTPTFNTGNFKARFFFKDAN
jgi:hypothetical protein